jgi:hypothetical protein
MINNEKQSHKNLPTEAGGSIAFSYEYDQPFFNFNLSKQNSNNYVRTSTKVQDLKSKEKKIMKADEIKSDLIFLETNLNDH